MKTFTVPTRDQVSEANQGIFDNLQKSLGFVPNLYATMALSPNALGKFLAYQNAKSTLNLREREVVNLVVSQINNCDYCLAAHTAIAKLNKFSDEEILDIRAGYSNDSKLDALVKFTAAVTNNKGRVPADATDAFYAAGYNDANLVDIVLQVSDKVAMNYLFNLVRIPVDFPAAPALETANA